MIRGFLMVLTRIKLRLHSIHQLSKVTQTGRNNNVFGRINIVNPKNLSIGDNCSFNHDVYINATNRIMIGNDVTFSAGSKVIATGIDYRSWANGNKKHSSNTTIVIGDHVWVGANAIILEGVNIRGKYVVIAANTVITHDILEDYVIYAGVPGKRIKSFRDDINAKRMNR